MLRAHPRAGYYRTIEGPGYQVFQPVSMPPVPPVDLAAIAPELAAASLALGRLDGLACLVPDVDRFVAMYVRREAVLSAQIEGTQASLSDLLTLDAEPSGSDPRAAADIGAVVNYVRALNIGLEVMAPSGPTAELLRKLHVELMQDTRGEAAWPGAYRTTQNYISRPGARLEIERAIFVPPSPDQVPALMQDLERYILAADDTPALVRCAVAHVQFETIHPFLDGNGRLGRLLISLMLHHRRLLTRPLLYLSVYFKRHQRDYYECLMRVREEGDYEGWLRFFLRGVQEIADDAASTIRGIVALRDEHLSLIRRSLQARSRAPELLELLFRHPYVTARMLEHRLDVAPATANALLADFERIGILKEVTGRKRDRQYRYSAYLDLFDADAR